MPLLFGLSGKWGLINAYRHTRGFDPAALKQLYGAFDAAWDSIRDSTSEADRESVRDVVSKAIFGLARHGYRNADHLATYGAYRGRLFIDLRC